MIGPHQGKELELMLAGQKHLAMFCESIMPGKVIPEHIIPENAFKPYVLNGMITRSSCCFSPAQIPYPIQYVCFTTRHNEWRAEAFFWMHNEYLSGKRSFDDAYEYFVGRLLGYTEEDIQDYLESLQ